jgi:hypothetical protein
MVMAYDRDNIGTDISERKMTRIHEASEKRGKPNIWTKNLKRSISNAKLLIRAVWQVM